MTIYDQEALRASSKRVGHGGGSRFSCGPMGFATARGKRERNEDCCRVDPFEGLVALADGVSGAPYGDVFSLVGCEGAFRSFEAGGTLEEVLLHANEAALEAADLMGLSDARCGAAILLANFDEESASVVSAGDCSALLLHEGVLEQICGKDRADGGRLRTGIGFTVNPDFIRVDFKIRPGDRVLLCSDGVTDALDTATLAAMLGTRETPPNLARSIADEAARCGWDNATVVVLFA